MSMTPEDYAYDMYLNEKYREKYEKKLDQEAIKKHKENLKKDYIHDYLMEHSSEKEEKIKYCIKQSKILYENDFYNSSTIHSVIAIELIIKYFLVRPIFNGMFLYREWADILFEKIISERKYHQDKKILPALLRIWDIEVTEHKLKNGSQFWESLRQTIKVRNECIHNTKIISKKEAEIALDSLEKLVNITKTICQKVEYSFDLNI